MLTTRSLMMFGGVAAMFGTILAASGFTSEGSQQVLLAMGAIVALTLTRAPRPR